VTAEVGVFSDSGAVLIGVSDYDDPEFLPIRAARNSLQAMRALLADPGLCGWPPGQITVIENPASAADLAGQVADLAESTTGALLLYYVGHGALSPRGELCLTVTSTRPSRPKFSGLPWENIAEILRACPARARLVILDCCFAGQAIEALSGDGDPGLADIAHIEGVYTLTATTRNRTAHVPPPGQQDTACTSFTGELRDLIRSGIPGKPPWLTFGDIYPVLRQRLRAKALPAPNQRGTDTAYQFPFTANAAARIGPEARGILPEGSGTGGVAHKSREPARADRARVTRILDDAERIAESIAGGHWKARALASFAGAVAATDPDRAARLSADAERIAQSITREEWKGKMLADIAGAVAATDPDRAERIAQSITSMNAKARALASVAGAVGATDPDRAARLSADAERIAQSITPEDWKAETLASFAGAVAATDPDRAERIAQSITRQGRKARALASVAGAVAATDPDRAARLSADAERIAQSITSEDWKAETLASVAGAVAATDPDRAERIAQSITSEPRKEGALADIAGAVAATDPDRAERIAQSITGMYAKAQALAGIAGAVAATDPDRAERIAQSITSEHWKAQALAKIVETWNHGEDRTAADGLSGLAGSGRSAPTSPAT